MRKTAFFMILVAAAAFHPFLYADGQQIAKVYQIDKAHKVIVISGQIQDKLSTGDKVYAKTSSGFVELVVTMPMMSVAKCRIPPVNDPSDFAKIEAGQEIFVGVKPAVRGVQYASGDSLKGIWKESWQPGRQSDVAYNDIYVIDLSSSAPVRLCGSDGSFVHNAGYRNGVLTFTQHTSFDVTYTLSPDRSGTVLSGTAVSVKGKFAVKWEKVDASCGEESVSLSFLQGLWKEFWAPGQETNVTYNDIYLISTSGGISIRLEKEDGGDISSIEFSDGWLSFTQKTAFDVKYKLKLDTSGRILEGTATTPHKTVPIRWEKQ